MACGDNAHPAGSGSLSVVVFNRQTDWIHPSNPVALQALVDVGAAHDWAVTTFDDPTRFTPELLRTTDVVVFSLTSGNVLDDASREALGAFFTSGGGFVGLHSPSHTEWDWPLYLQKVVPVTFLTHPYPMNVLTGPLYPYTLIAIQHATIFAIIFAQAVAAAVLAVAAIVRRVDRRAP